MHLVVFEPADPFELAPFSLTRPVFALPLGLGTLLERAVRVYRPTRLTLWCRPLFEPFCRRLTLPLPFDVNCPLNGEPAVLLDGRTYADFPLQRTQQPGLCPEDFIPPTPPAEAKLVGRPWDLVRLNDAALREDAALFHGNPPPEGPWHVLGDVQVRGAVTLQPGVVLDGREGPVMLDDGVKIGANSVILGPAYLGPGTVISPLSTIGPAVRLGPMCRMGGECQKLVVIGHSNKAHGGYAGDTVLGEWVNLGAGTNTSNLKTTYGEVSVAGKPTGLQFLGSMIGDHVKTAIGTRLMTGSRIGPGCMIAASSVPTVVEPMTFLTDTGPQEYDPDKAIEVARRVMSRRNVEWTEADGTVMRSLRPA